MFSFQKCGVAAALTVTLSSCALAVSVPQTLVGEWLTAPDHPASFYDPTKQDYRQTTHGAQRMVIKADGTYERVWLRTSAVPGYFGALLIACETVDIEWERGTVEVKGSQLLLHPTLAKSKNGALAAQHNSGCVAIAGIESPRTPRDQTLNWSIKDQKLNLSSNGSTVQLQARSKQNNPTQHSKLSAHLQGEWQNGSVSTLEYYDPASGKWSDAGGTSILLKMHGDGTYERTGILVVTTFSCTSKLFVQEKGTVLEQNDQLNFTPRTSLSMGYTCSPSNSYREENKVKPTSVKYTLEQAGTAAAVLSLNGGEGSIRYNRPRTGSTSTTSSTTTPAAPTKPPVKPIRTDGSGSWNGLFTSDAGETLAITLSVDEDWRGIMGTWSVEGSYAGTVMGNREKGTLTFTLSDDHETTFTVQGVFQEDDRDPRYPVRGFSGTFQTSDNTGASLGGGTFNLTRP